MASEAAFSRPSLAKVLPARADVTFLLASLALQLTLGTLFGHVYDERINMATGYLVATGQNPYVPQDLSSVFHNPLFSGMTSIGYPPAWPLVLGVIYRLSYAVFPSLLLYNLAIKIPIILANLALAYTVRLILRQQEVDPGTAHKAWLFMLFNPFLLYFTTAWGQIDSLVALLAILSLVMLHKHQQAASAGALALAIALKPTALPIALVAAAALWPRWRTLAQYLAIFASLLVLLCVLPFILLGWDPSIIIQHWNAVFSVSGGMALTSVYELFKDTYSMPGAWWLLGFAWLPSILITTLLLRKGSQELPDLLKNSLVLTSVFFLTRTWLSEPNLALLLPLVVLLVYTGRLPRPALAATWILPFAFTVFNTSPPQLLFPILPDLMHRLLQGMDAFRSARLAIRTALVLPWQALGWWMVGRSLPKGKRLPQ